MTRSVKEMTKADINLIIDYFLESSPEFLRGMGVDINKLTGKKERSKINLDDFKFYRCIFIVNISPGFLCQKYHYISKEIL
jgi:hypothetical protein